MKNGFPEKITIREVGPREGFQNFKTVVPTESKLELIESLSQSGLREIEITSFVRPDKVPQLADAEELVSRLKPVKGVRYSALYLNTVGFKRCVATGKLNTKGWLYTSASEQFLKANSNTTIEAALNTIPEWISLFSQSRAPLHGLMISNSFGCSYQGAISSSTVADLVSRYLNCLSESNSQLKEICLADTVGMANPSTIEACILALEPFGIPISLHLHDTRGLGLTNAYVGLRLGVSTFESSVGGIGGCPFTPGAAGNIATEDLVYLCNSLGIETGVDLAKLKSSARLCASIMGCSLPGRVYKTEI